jgi:hypothetical protein
MISIPREVIRQLAVAVEHAGVSDDAGILAGNPSKVLVADILRLGRSVGVDYCALFASASASSITSGADSFRARVMAMN